MARAREFSRIERVAATVRKVLAAPINELARGEAAALATVTEVELSPDLRHATVYLSVYGEGLDREAFVRSLKLHASELQHTVAANLRTKRTPVLSFRLDDAIARGDRITRLLRPGGGADGGD